MLELAGTTGSQPRAFLEVGGLTVARQQLGLALALDCERVICLAREVGPELLELQRIAETSKVQFHAITAARGLSSLVTAADELIVLADGLMVEPRAAVELLSTGPGVLAQPIDLGLQAGFERIDLNSASGGAMRLPGRLVDRLTELPPDIDAISALLRIALQAGVPLRRIDPAGERAEPWLLVRSEDEAHVTETGWLEQHLPVADRVTPASWLARFLARLAGPALLHLRGGLTALRGGAVTLLALALGAGWFGVTVVGLALAVLGWIVFETADMLAAAERRALLLPAPRFQLASAYALALDLALVLIAAVGVAGQAIAPLVAALFAPAMVVALVRIVPRALNLGWTAWLGDRALLAVVLGFAQFSGQAAIIHQLLAILLVLTCLAWPNGKRG